MTIFDYSCVLSLMFSMCKTKNDFVNLAFTNKTTIKFAREYHLFEIWKCVQDEFDATKVCNNLCSKGDLNALKSLYAMYGFYKSDIIEWRCEYIDDEKTILKYEGPMYSVLCGGQLKVLQWLIEIFDTKIDDLHIKIQNVGETFNIVFSAFELAAGSGNIELCKYVSSLYLDDLPKAHVVGAFKFACINDHMKMCKWLVKTYELSVDEDADIIYGNLSYGDLNCAMFDICYDLAKNCNLRLLKWLYSMKLLYEHHIRSDINDVFWCTFTHVGTYDIDRIFDVAEWLYSTFEIDIKNYHGYKFSDYDESDEYDEDTNLSLGEEFLSFFKTYNKLIDNGHIEHATWLYEKTECNRDDNKNSDNE
jgi:hypothetical protein